LGDHPKAPVNWHDLMYCQSEIADPELYLCLKNALSAMPSGKQTYWDLLVTDMITKMVGGLKNTIKARKEATKNEEAFWDNIDWDNLDWDNLDWLDGLDSSAAIAAANDGVPDGYDEDEYEMNPYYTARSFFMIIMNAKEKDVGALVVMPEITDSDWPKGTDEINVITDLLNDVTCGLLNLTADRDDEPSVQLTFTVNFKKHNTYFNVKKKSEKIDVFKGTMSLEMRSLTDTNVKPVTVTKVNTPANRLSVVVTGSKYYYDLPKLEELKEFPKMVEKLLLWMVNDF